MVRQCNTHLSSLTASKPTPQPGPSYCMGCPCEVADQQALHTVPAGQPGLSKRQGPWEHCLAQSQQDPAWCTQSPRSILERPARQQPVQAPSPLLGGMRWNRDLLESWSGARTLGLAGAIGQETPPGASRGSRHHHTAPQGRAGSGSCHERKACFSGKTLLGGDLALCKQPRSASSSSTTCLGA